MFPAGERHKAQARCTLKLWHLRRWLSDKVVCVYLVQPCQLLGLRLHCNATGGVRGPCAAQLLGQLLCTPS